MLAFEDYTFEEYRELIERWTKMVNKRGVTLSGGQPVPVTFWKTFLGLTRKQHQDMFNGTFKNKTGCVPKYIGRTLELAELLNKVSPDDFDRQVRWQIPKFEADKTS
ncbi:hypothetical protein [Aliagarivorans taiwanensis]|uniref:hypothetical protein n=1 Tax=Aliagarivorans taiwanensis TaxID=561966 RepID=UPI0003F69CAA|nr:hypothetical protein [Aliagarivorans taiwanensis]